MGKRQNTAWAMVACAVAVPLGSGAALAQGGLLGGGPAWLPSIPLSPAAVANGAQVSYSAGMEFVTVSNYGNGPNPAFPGVNPPEFSDDSRGRGSVSEYTGNARVCCPCRAATPPRRRHPAREFTALGGTQHTGGWPGHPPGLRARYQSLRAVQGGIGEICARL